MLFKGTGRDARKIADIAVPAGIEIDGLADFVAGCPWKLCRIAVNETLQLVLQIVVHLLSFKVQKLDAVVIEGVVACGDHDAAVEIFGSGDIADAGRRRDVQKIRVGTG